MRYQAEMLDLLHQHPLTLWTLADLLVSAMDAHLHPHLLPREVFTMTQRIQTSINTLFVAFTCFFITWVMVPFIQDSPQEWLASTANHLEIRIALAAFQISGAVAVLALIICVVPLLIVMVRQAIQKREGALIGQLATPFLLAGLLVGYSFVAQPRWWRRFSLNVWNGADASLALKLSFFILAALCFDISVW
ncbi:MAG: hypothetical protein H0U76_08280, partial [Ktedonobacteraceae bacterium]|nr:hypothetical protein [Ktedonobacteraceae bacterium]